MAPAGLALRVGVALSTKRRVCWRRLAHSMEQMGAVVGAPMGEAFCATVMPSDAFSASLTTADAWRRRTRGRTRATYAARASSLVCFAALAAFAAATCAGKAAAHVACAA